MMERQTLLNPGITTMREIQWGRSLAVVNQLRRLTEPYFLTNAWGFCVCSFSCGLDDVLREGGHPEEGLHGVKPQLHRVWNKTQCP